MKDYLNLFYAMIDKIHNWDNLIRSKSYYYNFLENHNIDYLVDYFEKYSKIYQIIL